MLLDHIVLRLFAKDDFKQVQNIYAEGLKTGIATFETKVPPWSEWDKKYIKSCRLVAELNDEIIGFAVLAQVSNRNVYKGVAEVSIYISEAIRGKGVGKLLLNTLITESETQGFWTLHAGIFPENKTSIRLHKSCGFRVVGVKEKIGKLNGEWYDNCLLERRSKHIF